MVATPLVFKYRIHMKKISCILLITCVCTIAHAQQIITTIKETGAFPIQTSAIYVDSQDHWLVQKAATLFQTDIEKVTGKKPALLHATGSANNLIIIGSLDKSPLIQQLVSARIINVDSIKGKWEAYQVQVVSKPLPGIDNALVIVGSDRRGTAFGVFELSQQAGVSPWYWWADVPVKTTNELYAKNKVQLRDAPAVKYRGIFINDEAPCLSAWSKATFGGFNHLFYEKVFELLLRHKSNFIWPAMWGNAFYDDDSLNAVVADQYGIVIGTSHHEPMGRAHDEWRRYGKGKWNYDSNEVQLKKFWENGVRRLRNYEGIVTVGMRGDGDMPMSRESNTSLLERIVTDQRTIIKDVTGRDASATPQAWALYKEVQDYYDKGMRVPDDVTLLLCDDNWGNVRKLPKLNAPVRSGGYGMYYHFDYVGGPRNYKWINTNSIPRIWEQMHLTYEYGVDRIWIVNVGDIKPMELPISFFLDYAWDPKKWNAENLDQYTVNWAASQFGTEHAALIANILSTYTQYNSRRKPELLSPDTYSLTNFEEADDVVEGYNELVLVAGVIGSLLPASYKDAYYQLVFHPIEASANLNELYVTVGKNRLYAKQGRAITNELAERSRELYMKDSLISYHYNKVIANGKWNHMMDQTHIGYTYWQQPPVNKMPEVKTISLPNKAIMRVAMDGSEKVWPDDTAAAVLPEIDRYFPFTHYIDVFNGGTVPFNYTVTADVPWVRINHAEGKIEKEQRIRIFVDPHVFPNKNYRVPVTITGEGQTKVIVYLPVNGNKFPEWDKQPGIVEHNKYIAIEADQYTSASNDSNRRWRRIPGIGRTGSGMTIMPVTSSAREPVKANPYLAYTIYCTDTGLVKVMAYCSPTLPFNESNGLRYAVAIDDETPQVMNLHANENDRIWGQSVSNNIRIITSQHSVQKAGKHTLKLYALDPGVVWQKLVLDFGGMPSSYLGPPSLWWDINKFRAIMKE
jgi:hypothetical protein